MNIIKNITTILITVLFNAISFYKLMISSLDINYVLMIMIVFVFLSIVLNMLVIENK